MSDSGSRNTLQVAFGLKDGRLFEPTQIDSGLRCGCVCPGCCVDLITRHSPYGRVTPHFAHATKAMCSTGLETALHLAAKQLISDRRKLYFPELLAQASKVGVSGRAYDRKAVLRRAGLASMQDVRLEEKVGAIRPDLVAEVAEDGLVVQVEIANTHFITPEKLTLIERQGVATLEVDVSDLINVNFETLSKRLFEPSERAHWVFHPDMATQLGQLGVLLSVDLEADRGRWEDRQAAQAMTEIFRRAQDYQLSSERTDTALALAEGRAAALVKTRSTPHHKLLADALDCMGIGESSISRIFPVNIRGGSAIDARPFVWQVLAFADLICPALENNVRTISTVQIRAWLSERFEVDSSTNSVAAAIWDFMSGLAKLKILHRTCGQDFLIAVPDAGGAMRVAMDATAGGNKELRWSDYWPAQERSSAVSKVFSSIYGYGYCWESLAGLLSEVRQRETPAETMAYYQTPAKGNIEAKALRRYFLCTGLSEVLG